MEKLKVTEEQFLALNEYCDEMNSLNEVENMKIINYLLNKVGRFLSEEFKCLNNLDHSEMARCLFIGYEKEKSGEEEILHIYNHHKHKIDNCNNFSLRELEDSNLIVVVMEEILKHLNVKIEGIN